MTLPVTVDEAFELLRKRVTPLSSEKVLLENAYGRMLRQTVICDRDLPPFDRVMMDGVAVKYSRSTRQWKILAVQYAGDNPLSLEKSGTCFEIMTGSVLPLNADTIIPLEDYRIEDDIVTLRKNISVKKGQFIHRRGSVSRIGDRLIEDEIMLEGRSLALCASVGLPKLEVTRKPKVVFISTGNELVKPEHRPESSQIRRSSDQIVRSELKKLNIPLRKNLHLPDDRESILEHLNQLKEQEDLIVLSGGVSKGRTDFIPTCAWEAGFEIIYHGIRQKPGGPMLAARHPSGTILLGLPGNPLSSLVCTRLYLRTVLNSLCGYPLNRDKILLLEEPNNPLPKGRLLPVSLMKDKTNRKIGKIVYPHTSGDMVSVLQSDGLVYLPIEQQDDSARNSEYDYFDWSL